jgi:hypothetical protein
VSPDFGTLFLTATRRRRKWKAVEQSRAKGVSVYTEYLLTMPIITTSQARHQGWASGPGEPVNRQTVHHQITLITAITTSLSSAVSRIEGTAEMPMISFLEAGARLQLGKEKRKKELQI